MANTVSSLAEDVAPPRFVDCHAHYIEPERPDRPYAYPGTLAPITFDELADRAPWAGIDRVVQVTASTMGYDNRYSIEGAEARPDRVLGVIGRFDPLAPGVADRLAEYWAQPKLLGVRLTLFQDPAASRWLVDRALEPFLAAAAQQGVPVCVHAPFQNAALLETVRRHPGVRFIVDHMGIRHERGLAAHDAFRQWPDLMRIATLPNAWVKVSYFPEAVMESEGYPYPTAQQRLHELVEHAGHERLIWGSNFPPVERACSWRQSLDFMLEACAFLPTAHRDQILGGNFVRDFSR
jgi:predicted TIM-barrel fold metal-dependent hydrolase